MPERSWLPVLWLAAAMAVSGSAWSHGLSIFAAADGARIEGQVRLAGAGPAAQGRVRVLDPDGSRLAELELDAEGRFHYLATAPHEHLLVAETADGHRAEWRVPAEELAAGFGASGPSAGASPGCADLPAIEQAVARAVRPLREQLALERERARLRDVLGGIGYILGLAGLWAWWRARDRDRPS